MLQKVLLGDELLFTFFALYLMGWATLHAFNINFHPPNVCTKCWKTEVSKYAALSRMIGTLAAVPSRVVSEASWSKSFNIIRLENIKETSLFLGKFGL